MRNRAIESAALCLIGAVLSSCQNAEHAREEAGTEDAWVDGEVFAETSDDAAWEAVEGDAYAEADATEADFDASPDEAAEMPSAPVPAPAPPPPSAPTTAAPRSPSEGATALRALSERGNWLTGGDRGTLTRDALAAVLETCEARAVRPRACASQVTNRVGPFVALPAPVAREARLLLRICGAAQSLGQCRQAIEDERYVRNQDIGRAEPNTLAMRQYEPIVWSVAIRRSELQILPGEAEVIEESAVDAPTTRTAVDNAITFTENTCFVLEYDAAAFAVADDTSCPDYRRGGTPYTARWTVEPLRSGAQQMWVKAVHRREGRTLPAETVPTSPFTIDVEDWKIAWIKNLDLWQQLLAAVGLIFTTVIGWKIWRLFGGRNKSGPGEG